MEPLDCRHFFTDSEGNVYIYKINSNTLYILQFDTEDYTERIILLEKIDTIINRSGMKWALRRKTDALAVLSLIEITNIIMACDYMKIQFNGEKIIFHSIGRTLDIGKDINNEVAKVLENKKNEYYLDIK